MDILYVALGIVGFIIGGYILFVFPIQFNNYFEDIYGIKAWSWIFSVINSIFIIATWYEGSASVKFIPLLIVTIMLILVSLIYCVCKAIKANASAIDVIGAIAAQIVSSIAIIVILIFILLIMDKRKRYRSRRG